MLPPDINMSFQDFTVDASASSPQAGGAIRFGLLAIKNVGTNIVNVIIEERSRGGPYAGLTNFLERIHHRDLNKKSLESLIKSGAFDSLGIERGQALENIEEILRFNQAAKKSAVSSQNSLFSGAALATSLRMKPAAAADKKSKLLWEKELLGLYLTDHPMNAYMDKVKDIASPIRNVLKMKASDGASDRGPRVRLAGIISGVQQIFTKTGQPMLFVTLEDLSDNMEMLVFSDTLSKYQNLFQENKAILASGRVSWRGDEPKLICDAVKEL